MYADNDTREGYQSLKEILKYQIVPQSVKEIMEDFPKTFSYLDKFNIGIGLNLFLGEYSTQYASTLAYVSSYARWDTNENPVVFDMFYSLAVNVSNVLFENQETGSLTEEGRTNLEITIAHEMMHAMMFETLTAGMIRQDQYANYQKGFPTWFIEGTAQAVGGGGDILRRKMYLDEDMSVEEIQEALEYYYLTKDNYQSNYGTGYLAIMYLGSIIEGTDSVEEAAIAKGIDQLLSDILKGKSLERAIRENTKYTSVDDFADKFPADAASFTKRFLAKIGDGMGALAAENYQATDILPNTVIDENVFYLDVTKRELYNIYPKNYIVVSGGMLEVDGLAGPGYR